MVLSMSNTNQPHLPQRITVTMKFNFNSIFYVRYKSEEISPAVSRLCTLGLHVLSLNNVGKNNCYANSVLTMILNLKPLKCVLENHEIKDHLGPVGKEVCRLMHLPKGKQQSLAVLRSLVANTLRRQAGENIGQDYDGQRQHDASEFLGTLIQCLLDELKDTKTSGDAIKELLTGTLLVSRVCFSCGKKNCRLEEMDNPLTLKLNREWEAWILEDLVNHSSLAAGSTVMEMNCSACSPYQNVLHEETKEYYRLPRILFLTAGRFLTRTVAGDGVVTMKIKDTIIVTPNLRVGCTGDQSEEYSLSSYVSHLGEEAVSGHYNVNLRDEETGTFALCDDGSGFMQATHTGMVNICAIWSDKNGGKFFFRKNDHTRGGGAKGGLAKDHTFSDFFLKPSLTCTPFVVSKIIVCSVVFQS